MSFYQPNFDALADLGSVSCALSKNVSKEMNIIRNSSVPTISHFKMHIPANVINIIPKSNREDTLRIFKTKLKEDKAFDMIELEHGKGKRNPYNDEIKRKDAKSAIDLLVEKGKQEYHKKKQQKPMGSMYVNDLWARSYEVNVRRKAGINKELRKEEDLKRRPLEIKLNEALNYFEQRFSFAQTDRTKPSIFSKTQRKNLGLPLQTESNDYNDSEYEDKSQRFFYTEPEENNIPFPDDFNPKYKGYLPQLSIKKSISSTHRRIVSIGMNSALSSPLSGSPTLSPGKPNTERTMSKFSWKLEEISAVRGLTEEALPDEKFIPLSARSSKKFKIPLIIEKRKKSKAKAELSEKSGALQDLISMCKTEADTNVELKNDLHAVQNVLREKIVKKKQKKNDEKRNQLLEECKTTLEKRKNMPKN